VVNARNNAASFSAARAGMRSSIVSVGGLSRRASREMVHVDVRRNSESNRPTSARPAIPSVAECNTE
jgi:hypothetical protein